MKRLAVVFGILLGLLGLVGVASAQDYSVLVRPDEVIVEPGHGIQFHAQLFARNGTPVAGATYHWRVEPRELGTITDDGFFMAGRRPGKGHVIAVAKVGGSRYVGTADVQVGLPQPPPLKVIVWPRRAVVQPGDTLRFRLRVEDEHGHKIRPDRVEWRVRLEEIGRINAKGLFHAAPRPGHGEIIAVVSVNGRVEKGKARVIIGPPPTGVIRGTIVDEDTQEPLVGARVAAYRVGEPKWVRKAKTDSLGNYELGRLFPGVYVLVAKARGYLVEYYDGVSKFSEATPVQVAEDDTLEGYNFALNPGGKILGTVTSEEDGQPLAGAHVMAVLVVQPRVKLHAITGEDGTYEIDGVPTGTYKAAAVKVGYALEWYQDAATEQEAALIRVEAPDEVTGIDFTLAMRSAIEGTITDVISGEPLRHALVFANRLSAVPERHPELFFARTDSLGHYVLPVPPGTYALGAVHRGYRPVFYQQKLDPRQADPVTVVENQHTTGIDIALVPFGTISGTVVDDSTGQPIAGAKVSAARLGHPKHHDWRHLFPGWPVDPRRIPDFPKDVIDHLTRSAFHTRTAEDGTYTFPGLPAGKYLVRAAAKGYVAEYYDNTTNIREATPVVVKDSTETGGIDFALGHGASISGMVFSEADSTPIEGAVVVLHRKGYGELRKVRTAEDGTFAFSGLKPGTYFLAAAASGYRPEFYDNATSIRTATPIQVTDSEQITDINIGLQERQGDRGAIVGRVISDADQSPIEGAWVYALPVRGGHVYWGISGPDGTYRIGGVKSGLYYVLAWARGYVAEFYDNAHRIGAAKPVPVNAPNVVGPINFSLRPRHHGFFAITGQVVDPQGQPVEGALVVAETDSEEVATVPTDGFGSFVMADLPDGTYKLRISVPGSGDVYYGGGEDPTAAQEVSLGPDNPEAQVQVELTSGTTAVESAADGTVPAAFGLDQNYPNPFNPTTQIRYQLPVASEVTVQILNLRGQVVRTLVHGREAAGVHVVTWDGRDESGSNLASGVYFYRLEARGTDGRRFAQVRKMSLIR